MAELLRNGQITNSEVYFEDNNLVGICAEFNIPELEWGMVTHETLGQVAIFEAPSRPLQALKGSLKMAFPEPELLEMAYNPTRVYPWQLHKKVDIMGPDGFDTGKSYTLITVCGLMFTKVGLGTAKLGDLMDQEMDFTCMRLSQRVHDSEKQIFAVDVFANTVQVGGKDVWSR